MINVVQCSVCLDGDIELIFSCLTNECQYQLCSSCVKSAFEDASGINAKNCPFCKKPSAKQMVESLCGQGAVHHVENELRSKVEFEMQAQNVKRKDGEKEMVELSARAREYFVDLSEELNMSCPRCGCVFDDYEGCNALTCCNSVCGAAICAICLKDCGHDAHQHVQTVHGDLFDKKMFKDSKNVREKEIVSSFIASLNEPLEVKELVQIEVDKLSPEFTGCQATGTASFLKTSRDCLKFALENDRLSLLNSERGQVDQRGGLDFHNISPRNAIPENYRLLLVSGGGYTCEIQLLKLVGTKWGVVDLPGNGSTSNADDGELLNDALINIEGALKCGVVAFEGQRHLFQTRNAPWQRQGIPSNGDISVSFQEVNRTGQVLDKKRALSDINCSEIKIIGVNQNQRLVSLNEHASKNDELLLFNSLRQYVSGSNLRRVFESIEVPVPETFGTLNEQQQHVAHPLYLRDASEVAGPPGTGKTKTITEMVRAVLHCTDHDIVVLSERNGAIDAIAEKMAGDCTQQNKSGVYEITDINLWMSVLAFGSAGSMGKSTKLFTSGEKLSHHPELVDLDAKVSKRRNVLETRRTAMVSDLCKKLETIEKYLPVHRLNDAIRFIEQNSALSEFSSASSVIATLRAMQNKIMDLSEQRLSSKRLSSKEIENVQFVIKGNKVLELLLGLPEKDPKIASKWAQESIGFVDKMFKLCRLLLEQDLFSIAIVEDLQTEIRKMEDIRKTTRGRIETEIQTKARVLISTIGSSHQLSPAFHNNNTLVEDLDELNIEDEEKPTIVVFDEAGCIPCYELLGLSRLGRNIKSMVCVGDKHQLTPYSPGGNNFSNRREKRGSVKSTVPKSILDVSAMKNDGKKNLTIQYRVPRDIASILNDRIYSGNYKTDLNCNVPLKGFRFVHTPASRFRNDDNEYVNREEVDQCIALVLESVADGVAMENIMIVTPYKKQQRKIEYMFRRNEIKVVVLTIDQCQGKEADVVIISLVRKPTRFLNKNRMNVALSRVRKKLFMVCDKRQFEAKSLDTQWECSLLARDLLELFKDNDEAF